MVAPLRARVEDSPVVVQHMAELKAHQDQLHKKLVEVWEANSKLHDEAMERKGNVSSAGSHFKLAGSHSLQALAKLIGGCAGCVAGCLHAVAKITPLTLALYESVAAVLIAMGGCFSRAPVAELATAERIVMHRRISRGTDKRKHNAAEKTVEKKRAELYVAEDKWEECTTGVWFPRHPLKQRWDLLVLFLIMYSCVSVPFRIGMNADAEGAMWLLEVVVTLVFLTDLCFNFNTAFLEGPNWVIHRGMIAGNYLRSWFIIDSLSSVPVELIDLFTAQQQAIAAAAGEESDSIMMKSLRALRMVRLLRMLRLLKMQQYIDELEDQFGMNMQILNIVRMVLALIYLMHLLGCFWFYVASNSGYETTWITEYDDGSAVSADTSVQYLYSVYWALTTLTTVGYGDIVPANNSERTYALFSLLIGALVFGYMLSMIGELLSNIDKNAVKLDAKLDDVKAFTRWFKMGPDLAARVRKYYEIYYGNKSAMDEEDIVVNLAPSLREEVVRHMLAKTVARIPMFSDEYCDYATQAFQLEVHPLLKPVVYEMGEVVVSKHNEGIDLFFLNKGTVAAQSALDGRALFAITDVGSFIGEHALFNQPAELSYTAVTRCEFFCLSKSDLYALLDKFPRARRELAEFVFEDLLRHQMLRFWAFKMILGEVRLRDERMAAALQLQVSWMRRMIVGLQAARVTYGERGLMQLMPGVFGLEDTDEASDEAPAASSSGGGGASGGLPDSAMRGVLASLELERGKLQKKEMQLERQAQAIQKAVEKLADQLHSS